jgi:hypothetical protein
MIRDPARLSALLLAMAACGPGSGTAGGAASAVAEGVRAAPAVRDTAEARQTVLRLQNELVQGWVRRDPAPAERTMAAEYVGVGIDGSRATGAQAIAYLRRVSGEPSPLDSARLDSATARVYADVAVAQAVGTLWGRSERRPFTDRFRATDVFVWRDGRWQILVHHPTRITGGP